MESNWQDDLSLLESMDYMLTNEVDCDISFKLGKAGSDVIPAHKFVLASRSSVFRAMLYGPLAEKGCLVDIPDVESDIFKCFLRYVYTDKCMITSDNVTALMYPAHKYNVRRLVKECGQFMMENMSTANVCTIMENAHLFDNRELRQRCLEFIEKNCDDIMESKFLTDLGPECLGEVLRSDELGASEEDIFAAVVSWADCRCTEEGLEVNGSNRRQVLGDLLYLVRFPLMSADNFAIISEQNTGLFKSREEFELLRGHITKDFLQTSFPSEKRKQKTYLEDVCYRFQEHEVVHGWNYTNPDTLQFKVSEAVDISGVILFGNPCSSYTVRVDIVELGRMADTTRTLKSTEKSFHVPFNKSVAIKPGTYYTLKADLQRGPPGYRGKNGRISETCKSTVFTFQTAPYRNNGTSINQGQIYGIVFKKKLYLLP